MTVGYREYSGRIRALDLEFLRCRKPTIVRKLDPTMLRLGPSYRPGSREIRIGETTNRDSCASLAEFDFPKHAGAAGRAEIDANRTTGIAGSLVATGISDNLDYPFVVEKRHYPEQGTRSLLAL
jgi:hypothetical protein